MKAIVDSYEHSQIQSLEISSDRLVELNQLFEKDNSNPKYLGIHQELEAGVIKLKSYYFIGYRWFNEDDEKYIHIAPKYHQGAQADYLKMLVECLKDPVVSKKLSDSYKIFFQEKWIEIHDEQDEVTPLLILYFLKIVKNITQKGLKKGYVRVTENLSSKIKGKILINQTIKHNHIKNRLDKTVCNHQVFTVNCLENKILKTALTQCSRNLHGLNNDDIGKLLKQNINAFELVNTREIFESDFSKIKHSPFYKEYKDALNLAKMIFKRFGFALNSSNKQHYHKIPPFYINMPELFERYVEVQLRKQYVDIIDGNRDMKFEFDMRPDFLLPSKKMILDAKYKYWYDKTVEDVAFKDDYQQLSLYARACKVRQRINLSNHEEAILLFIYPKIGGEKEIKFDFSDNGKFRKIHRIGIQIPIKESNR